MNSIPHRRPLSVTALSASLAAALAVAVAGLPGCDSSSDVVEILGAVRDWKGQPPAGGTSLSFTAFNDDVGKRAALETRALITSPAGYQAYFGHAAPSGVDLEHEWVIFYAAGAKPTGGYRAGIEAIDVVGDSLQIVTSLEQPGKCPAAQVATAPTVLVKLAAQRTRNVVFQQNDTVALCDDPTSPCAAILCGPNQECVVLLSNPPQARCQDISKPNACTSRSDCPKGLICSTEQGVCGEASSASALEIALDDADVVLDARHAADAGRIANGAVALQVVADAARERDDAVLGGDFDVVSRQRLVAGQLVVHARRQRPVSGHGDDRLRGRTLRQRCSYPRSRNQGRHPRHCNQPIPPTHDIPPPA